jgi:hypothetical protein
VSRLVGSEMCIRDRLSGDDGNETFIERLNEELNNLKK